MRDGRFGRLSFIRSAPQILKNILASLIRLASFASLSAAGLEGALRRPAPCWRRARHCRKGTTRLTVY